MSNILRRLLILLIYKLRSNNANYSIRHFSRRAITNKAILFLVLKLNFSLPKPKYRAFMIIQKVL
ncbi:hypothetical protein A1OE_269 [Candidatus Endolissoclinum faulkneri L2]|uniref:Uncharacterized protein n=1 Tax=Candidatus Endolissoclinum faulkneri L2 TaxID=1193729 RepID=K7YPI7_9PROT|nr:hypothetical protein A1OE_269 [Candidatus Endolissoclinum faulkneri L2]